MKVLFVASDRMEFPGILARTSGISQARIVADWSRYATLNGWQALFVANGAGPGRAAAAVDAAVGQFRPDVIVSTGFCGALSPKLGIADIVTATEIDGGADPLVCAGPPRPALQRNRDACVGPAADQGGCPTVFSGIIRSIPYVAQTAEEKRRLAETGAIAVEMEAAGIAERAESLRIPLFCVRAVTDLAGETMANDFNKALRSDGHFDTMLILRGTLRQPTVRIPELIRLRNRCSRAAQALGEFFDDCRF
jgi:adenosylhomocysteine nucleosidase